MGVYINGVLTPPVDAAELDGIPASLQPTAGKGGYVVTLASNGSALELLPTGDAVLTTRGQIIRRGATGPEALQARTVDTFLGGDGTDVVARTAAQTRASLYPSVAVSLASATGWSTTTAAGTTSVIDTGTERAILTVLAATATFTLASVARTTLPALGRYSIQARIAAWTGVAATDTEQMLVRMTGSGGTLSDLWIYGTEQVSLTGAATVPAGAVTVAGLLAGQGWVRVTVDGSQIVYACGVGSAGAAPTSWTTVGSVNNVGSTMQPYTSFGILIRRTVAQITALVAQFGTVSYQNLNP